MMNFIFVLAIVLICLSFVGALVYYFTVPDCLYRFVNSKIIMICLFLGIACLFISEYLKQQKLYDEVEAKISQGYHVIVNGQSADGSKIDIEKISVDRIKVSDNNSEIQITTIE